MANVEVYKAEIRRSFDLVKPISQEAASIFYPTLWEIDPSTKVSFGYDMRLCEGDITTHISLPKPLGVGASSIRGAIPS